MERSRVERGSSGLPDFQVIGKSPMPRSIEELLAEVLELPPEDRARIARTVLSSLLGDGSYGAAWEKEILRREHEIDEGTADLIPADEVFDELDTLLQ